MTRLGQVYPALLPHLSISITPKSRWGHYFWNWPFVLETTSLSPIPLSHLYFILRFNIMEGWDNLSWFLYPKGLLRHPHIVSLSLCDPLAWNLFEGWVWFVNWYLKRMGDDSVIDPQGDYKSDKWVRKSKPFTANLSTLSRLTLADPELR